MKPAAPVIRMLRAFRVFDVASFLTVLFLLIVVNNTFFEVETSYLRYSDLSCSDYYTNDYAMQFLYFL